MISKKEYEILKKLEIGVPISSRNCFDEMYSLQRDGIVYLEDNKYHLKGEWHRVMEEYENFIANEKRENETLKLAEKADKKSHNANVISLIAIIVPSLISIAALIVSILAYLND